MRVWIEIEIVCQGREGQNGWIDAMNWLRRQRGVCDYREGCQGVRCACVCCIWNSASQRAAKKGGERASAKTEARTETGRVCGCASLTTLLASISHAFHTLAYGRHIEERYLYVSQNSVGQDGRTRITLPNKGEGRMKGRTS